MDISSRIMALTYSGAAYTRCVVRISASCGGHEILIPRIDCEDAKDLSSTSLL